MVDPAYVLKKGQFYCDYTTNPDIPVLYIGDGLTQFQNLKPISGGEFEMPPADGQVYGMMNGKWEPQAIVLGEGESLPDTTIPDPANPPTPEDAVIGYVIGDVRSADGADIYICDHEGNIIQPTSGWFDTHLPWSGMVDVIDGSNSMIKVPRYWYRADTQPEGKPYAGNPRFTISSFEIPGFECDGSVFKDSTGSWKDFFLIGKYRARNVSNVGVSQSTGSPWIRVTRDNLDAACALNGPGYHLMSYQEWCAILQLCVIEKATFQLYPKDIRRDPTQCVYRGIQEFCYGPTVAGGVYKEWVSGIETGAARNLLVLERDGDRSMVDTGIVLPTGNFIAEIDNDPRIANYFLARNVIVAPYAMIPDYFQSAASRIGCLDFNASNANYGAFCLGFDYVSTVEATNISGRPSKI